MNISYLIIIIICILNLLPTMLYVIGTVCLLTVGLCTVTLSFFKAHPLLHVSRQHFNKYTTWYITNQLKHTHKNNRTLPRKWWVGHFVSWGNQSIFVPFILFLSLLFVCAHLLSHNVRYLCYITKYKMNVSSIYFSIVTIFHCSLTSSSVPLNFFRFLYFLFFCTRLWFFFFKAAHAQHCQEINVKYLWLHVRL